MVHDVGFYTNLLFDARYVPRYADLASVGALISLAIDNGLFGLQAATVGQIVALLTSLALAHGTIDFTRAIGILVRGRPDLAFGPVTRVSDIGEESV